MAKKLVEIFTRKDENGEFIFKGEEGRINVRREAKKLTSNAEFLFDDGEVIEISFEQKGPKRENGFLYKAFRSFRPNSKLGEYLRKRMNIQNGAPFTELDFQNYGRDDIELTLLAEGQYYEDFSV